MTVLKKNQAVPMIKEAIVLDLGDVARQAQKLRAAAEAKARGILEAAQDTAARLTREAHEEGYQKGYAEGLQKGLEDGRKTGHAEALEQSSQQLEKIQQSWLDAVNQWEPLRQAMEREARSAVLRFAVRFAEKIVHRTIEVDHAVIEEQVAATLSHVLRRTDVTIQICPEDRSILEQAMPQLRTRFTHLEHVHLVDDPNLGRGGCVVGYGQGRIDASVEEQLRRLVQLIMPNDTQAGPTEDGPAISPTATDAASNHGNQDIKDSQDEGNE